MFGTLLESRRRKQRSIGSTFISGTVHMLLVTGAVYASAKTSEPEARREETPTYTIVKPPEPTPPTPRDDRPPDEKPVEKGFKTVDVVITIPTVIPKINSALPETNPDDYIPNLGVRGGDPNGFVTRAAATSDSNYIFTNVDKVARLGADNPEPNYPSILKQAKQTGKVRVQFVVDTTGKADMNTIKVLESSNSLFVDEVMKVLPRYKFIPAQIGQKKVRMSVELPFEFKLDQKGG